MPSAPFEPPADPSEPNGDGASLESIDLVRGEAQPPPTWERPRLVPGPRAPASDASPPWPRPTVLRAPEPPPAPTPEQPAAAARDEPRPEEEPRFVDLGLGPDVGWVATEGVAGTQSGAAEGATWSRHSVTAPTATTTEDGADDRSTAVRLAPRRPLTAALVVVLILGVVGATLLAISRRQPAAPKAYAWETLPAPLLAQPQRRWAVELDGADPDRVAASAEHIFLARSNGSVVTISALAAADGRPLWQAEVAAPGSSVQQLELSGGLVIAVSGSNGLRTGVSAFDAATGARRWQTSVDASWVTVVSGTDPLVVLSGPSPRMATRVDGLDLAGGETRWSRSGVVGDLDGRRLALVENEDVITFDIADGHETGRWPGVASGMTARTVVVSGSRVVVLSEDDLRLAGVGTSRLDGSLDLGIGQLFTTIRTGGDQVTVLSQDGVAGIDLRSGRIDWTRGVTPRALARADGQTILLGWSDRWSGTMVTIDASNGREEGTRDIDGLVRRRRDRRSSYITRADFLADGATYQISGGGVQAYDLPGLQPLWELGPAQLGASAADVTATEAGLLISTTTGGLLLFN